MFRAFVVISIILATAPEAARLGDPRQDPQAPLRQSQKPPQPPPSRPVDATTPAPPCTVENHPYVVSFMDWPSKDFFCYGVLIAELWVVTVAHCFYRPTVGATGCFNYSTTPLSLDELHLSTGFRMYVTPGVAKRPKDAEQAEVKLVSDIYIMDGYYLDRYRICYRDLAMVKLQQPLKESKFVGHAKLPQGVIEDRYLYPTVRNSISKVMAVSVPTGGANNQVVCRQDIVVDSPAVCEKGFYAHPELPNYSEIICIVFPKDKKPGGYTGEGSPLMDNYTTLLGLGSHGYGGDGYKYYYIRVDRYLNFINKIMSTESSGSSRYFNILLLLIPVTCLIHTIYNKK